jgi:hypothetical protein
VEFVHRIGANEDWQPTAGLTGAVVHAYADVAVYIVEIHPPGGYDARGGPPLALLDVREEDLEVMWTPDRGSRGTA